MKERCARAYYAIGLGYYLYHWIAILGISAAAVPFIFHFSWLLLNVSVSFGIIALVAAIALYIRRVQQRRDAVNPLLDIIYANDTYSVPNGGNKGPFEFKRVFTVRARHDGVQFFQCKYKWSAEGNIRLEVSPPEVSMLADRFETDDSLEFAILRFPRPLRKNEEQSFTVTWTMTHENCAPRPFLSKVIDDFFPNGLTMTVNLPTVPKTKRRDVIRSRRSDISLKNIPDNDGQSLSIVWPIRYPRFDAKYKITWSL